eukprot:UN00426
MNYERPDESQRPAVGKFLGYDHIVILSSNAKAVSEWYALRFGMDIVAYRGLETGSRDVVSYVLKKGQFILVVTSPLKVTPEYATTMKEPECFAREIAISGDHVHDVSFAVADCEALYEKAIERGAVAVHAPITLKDEFGEVIICKIRTYGNVCHTFIQRNNYTGPFMPGYKAYDKVDPIQKLLPDTKLQFIDHIVGNQRDGEMESVVQHYLKVYDFHRYWSVDDKQICTEFSALRSIVVSDFDETVRFPVNEPAEGLKKSQIQEFVEFYGISSGIAPNNHIGVEGVGVQHVAIHTEDIISTISAMRARGVEFLRVPPTYYTELRKRLSKSPAFIKEDLDEIERLSILVDFEIDENGQGQYLLQLFTRPVTARPTLFFEIINRCGHKGFGVGNFGALFKALELEQAARGNL